jgi:ribonucleoside-diphosphate reductase alpha chain
MRQMGRMTNANISVGITYDFMAAVKADDDWQMVFLETRYLDFDKCRGRNLNKWRGSGKSVVLSKIEKAWRIWENIAESA